MIYIYTTIYVYVIIAVCVFNLICIMCFFFNICMYMDTYTSIFTIVLLLYLISVGKQLLYVFIYIYSHYLILYEHMLHASYAQNRHGSSFLRLFVGRCSAFRCIPTPVPPWTWAIYKAEKD